MIVIEPDEEVTFLGEVSENVFFDKRSNSYVFELLCSEMNGYRLSKPEKVLFCLTKKQYFQAKDISIGDFLYIEAIGASEKETQKANAINLAFVLTLKLKLKLKAKNNYNKKEKKDVQKF